MKYFGFWIYTGTNTGGCEGYGRDQYAQLFDDMVAGGMNLLVLCVNCKRMGFRSHLPYLANDQDMHNPVIASDNALIHEVIDLAHQRRIKIWIQQIANCYQMEGFDIPLPEGATLPGYKGFKFDLDTPGIFERAVERCTEVFDLFPEADGLSVELEGHSTLYSHAVDAFNAWAAANDHAEYDKLMSRAPNARSYPYRTVRSYTTHRQCELFARIKQEAKARQFRGALSTIGGVSTGPGTFIVETDLAQLAERCGGWSYIPYDYDRWTNQEASAGMCMRWPKSLGLETLFLARGVMTWGSWAADWMPISFEECWRRDFEDAMRTEVDGLLMFEADALTDGPHVSSDSLKEKGFADGMTARRALLRIAGECGVKGMG